MLLPFSQINMQNIKNVQIKGVLSKSKAKTVERKILEKWRNDKKKLNAEIIYGISLINKVLTALIINIKQIQ